MGRIIERIVAYEVWGDNDIGFSKQLNEGEMLVRCKDCYFSEVLQVASDCPETRWCKAFTNRRMVTDDDFCSYGEREGE